MMFFTVSPLALNIEPQVGSGQLRDLTELIQYFKRFLFVPFFFFLPPSANCTRTCSVKDDFGQTFRGTSGIIFTVF